MDREQREVPTEFPPGISGQAWDAQEDSPAAGGKAILRYGGEIVSTEPIDAGGSFAIEWPADRPRPEGAYQLTIAVPGYDSREMEVDVTDGDTSYRLGRVELTATSKD